MAKLLAAAFMPYSFFAIREAPQPKFSAFRVARKFGCRMN
jgi:hypothetical protein